MSIDFVTYCCDKDRERLYNALIDNVNSHGIKFNEVHLIHQRTRPEQEQHGVYPELVRLNQAIENFKPHYISESEYDEILKSFNINPDNPEADDYTHGWTAQHYWKHHCVNHLKAFMVSGADYLVMSDADCFIKSQRSGKSWVQEGIEILRSKPEILIVSPSDGNGGKTTQNMSQQLFVCDRKKLSGINFDIPFEGFRDGGPMQEYYFMLEGRIGRYMEKNNLWRYILPNEYRYWHAQWIWLLFSTLLFT